MHDSEFSLYYSTFSAIVAMEGDPDADVCICHGRGWVGSEIDTWHECRFHTGQPHPEDEPLSSDIDPWDFFKGRAESLPASEGPEPELNDDDIPF